MRPFRFAAVVVLVSVLTLFAIVRGDGSVGLALAPALTAAGLYATWKLPLRYPLFALTFFVLTLENPSAVPAEGLWKSPLYDVGAVLLAHMNLTFSHKWLIFSGIDLAVVCLLAAALHRWIGRSRIDRVGPSETAGPMRAFATVSLCGVAWMWIWGMSQDGADFASSLWQVQRVVYLPVFCLLFQIALRDRADRAALAKVFVAAACIKAMLAIYVRATVMPRPGETVLGYATTHDDSMLFAAAFCLLVAPLLETFDARRARRSVPILALLAVGMVANHRRIVWVEVGAALAVLFTLTPWTRTKRLLARAAVLASPVALLYLAIGWGSTAAIFEPVQLVRSIVDSHADASTEWRDWENYNLFFTLRQSPILGTGYGHGYIELVKLPDISQSYALYRFIPHNAILGLWAYGGFVGFTALWTMLIVGLFLAVRAHAHASKASDRAAALTALATIVIYFVHCYGDMGLGTWTSVFTVGPALAVASHLAVTTGAWPHPVRAVRKARAIARASHAPRQTPPILAMAGASS